MVKDKMTRLSFVASAQLFVASAQVFGGGRKLHARSPRAPKALLTHRDLFLVPCVFRI